MSDNVNFRTAAFGGFSKEDVMKYIAEFEFILNQANEKSEMKIKRLQNDLDFYNSIQTNLKVSKEELEETIISAINNRNIDTTEQNEQLTLRLGEALATIEHMQSENAELRQTSVTQSSQVDNQIDNLLKENQELHKKLQEESAKTSKLENLKETLVKLEIDAHLRAQNTRQHAETEAEVIIENAKEEAKKIINEAKFSVKDMIDKKDQFIIETKKNIEDVMTSTNVMYAKLQEEMQATFNMSGQVLETMNTFVKDVNGIIVSNTETNDD